MVSGPGLKFPGVTTCHYMSLLLQNQHQTSSDLLCELSEAQAIWSEADPPPAVEAPTVDGFQESGLHQAPLPWSAISCYQEPKRKPRAWAYVVHKPGSKALPTTIKPTTAMSRRQIVLG